MNLPSLDNINESVSFQIHFSVNKKMNMKIYFDACFHIAIGLANGLRSPVAWKNAQINHGLLRTKTSRFHQYIRNDCNEGNC